MNDVVNHIVSVVLDIGNINYTVFIKRIYFSLQHLLELPNIKSINIVIKLLGDALLDYIKYSVNVKVIYKIILDYKRTMAQNLLFIEGAL